VSTINLPSKGQTYPNCPETFSIAGLTVNQLKMLYGYEDLDVAVEQILKSVILEPKDFPVDILLNEDKYYICLLLKAITYGPDMTTNIYCPECKKQVEVHYNLLNDIEVTSIPEGFKNPYDIGKLPKCGDKITLKLLTHKDFKAINTRVTEIKEKYPDYEGDPTYPVMLSKYINTINGEVPIRADLEAYVDELSAMDAIYIEEKVKEVFFGVKPLITEKCSICGHEIMLPLPRLSTEFFRTGSV